MQRQLLSVVKTGVAAKDLLLDKDGCIVMCKHGIWVPRTKFWQNLMNLLCKSCIKGVNRYL